MTPDELNAIKARVEAASAPAWYWVRNYELSDMFGESEFHWALESEESAKNGRVVNHRLVLWSTEEELMDGSPFYSDPDLQLVAHAPADIRALLSHIDWLNMEHASSIGRERSDERGDTIKDMRKYLAEGLRKLGLEADDKISLTEVLAIVEKQQVEIARLTAALDAERCQRETAQTAIMRQEDEIAKLARLATFAAQVIRAIYADQEHRLTLDAIHYLQLLEGALSRAGLLDLKALDQTGYLHMHEGRAVDINRQAGEGE